MAYQAKRRKRFEEDFELVDEKGQVVHTLHVALDADDMAAKLYRKWEALTKTLTEVNEIKRQMGDKESMGDCIEKLGRAVVELMDAVFGPEDAQVIVEFYEGRYIELCKEVTPFISQVVIPRCSEIKKENQKNILQAYNRQQCRSVFRWMK